MVVVSYSGKEINAKLVYYGAGLSGKTTNLEAIYEAVPETSRGKMVSMKTQSDRTLFFDLLPLDLGEIMGFKTRFLLYTVPGQVFYNATRKLVLKGADGIVFVADSAIGKMDENRESLANLNTNLSEYGLRLEDIPWVLQYNKRDLPNVYSLDELNAELNPGGNVPFFEAVATQGGGVFETFRGISHLLMQKVTRELHRSGSNRAPRAVPTEPRTPPALEAMARPKAVTPEPEIRTPAGLDRPVDTAAPASPAHAMASDERAVAPEFAEETLSPEERPLSISRLNEPAGASDSPLVLEREPTVAVVRARAAAAAAAAGGSGPTEAPRFEERELSFDGSAQAASVGVAPDASPAAAPSRAATATAAAPESARREIVVPITLPAGESREIVLRIILQADDAN